MGSEHGQRAAGAWAARTACIEGAMLLVDLAFDAANDKALTEAGALPRCCRAAAVLLRGCCAPETYPPGAQCFASACSCCVWGALLIVCATPSVRQWLVETAGFTTVTVRLNDLAKSQVTLGDLAATPAPPDAHVFPNSPSRAPARGKAPRPSRPCP